MSTGFLLTGGYGGADPDDFFAALGTLTPAPDVILDIRLAPKGWSVRYSGQTFLDELAAACPGSRTRWVRKLGNAGRFDGTGMRLVDPSAIDDLVSVLRRGYNVLVICGCANESTCHRSLVKDLVSTQAPEVVHVSVPPVPPRPRRKASPEIA
jgi:hypothetical protein